jgi:hypothetical protein
MYKPTPWSRKINAVTLDVELSPEEEIRTCLTMAKGIVKYLDPPLLSGAVIANINRLQELGEVSWKDFLGWVKTENPTWLPILQRQRRGTLSERCKKLLSAVYHQVFS